MAIVNFNGNFQQQWSNFNFKTQYDLNARLARILGDVRKVLKVN